MIFLFIVAAVVAIVSLRGTTDNRGAHQDKCQGNLNNSCRYSKFCLLVRCLYLRHEVGWDLCELVTAAVNELEAFYLADPLAQLFLLAVNEANHNAEEDTLDQKAEATAGPVCCAAAIAAPTLASHKQDPHDDAGHRTAGDSRDGKA